MSNSISLKLPPSIIALCPLDNLREHSATFIKNKKLLPDYLEKLGNIPDSLLSTLFVIIEEKIWNGLDSTTQELLKSKHLQIEKVSDVDLVMSELTCQFAKTELEKFNHYVDGRQMGNNVLIHPEANIAQGVFIGENVTIDAGVIIYPHVTILHNVHIRANTVIFPQVTIYPNVTIGANCIIHASSVIGSDGFGFHFANGQHNKIATLGGVIIEDNVEIGSNTSIDGGTLAPTRIGKGTKIDNFVQIGHNVTIGNHVILCGHVAIGGSSKIGNFCVFGGKSGMGPQMSLGDACQVAGGALVNCDWPAKTTLGGHPARPIKEWLKGLAYVRNQSLS